MKCNTCAYFRPNGPTVGLCVFWPKVYVPPHGWVFPTMNGDEGCGQHKPLAAKDPLDLRTLDGR